MKKRRMGIFFLAFACVLGMSACSQQTASSSEAQSGASSVNAGGASSASDDHAVYGKVTAVDGSKITIAVGTLRGWQGGKSGTASGTGSGQSPQNGKGGASRSGGSNTSRPGTGNGGQNGLDPLTLTGESKTITISDAGILQFQSMGRGRGRQAASSGAEQNSSAAPSVSGSESSRSASLSDIKVGTILKITYQSDGTTPASVVILGGGR